MSDRVLTSVLLLVVSAASLSCYGNFRPRERPTDADADQDSDVDLEPDADADAGQDAEPDDGGDLDVDPDSDPDLDDDPDADGDADTDHDIVCGPDFHDEDGDGLDDDCDLCPTVIDPDQSNVDLDRLGDACEWPDAEETLHELSFFDPFGPFDPSSYEASTGTGWTAATDAVVGEIALFGTNLFLKDVVVSPPYAVESTVEVGSLQPNAWSGVLFATPDTEPVADRHFWYCTYSYAADKLEVWGWEGETYRPFASADAVGLDETVLRFRVLHDGSSVVCVVYDAVGSGHALVVAPTSLPSEMSGLVGLRVYEMAATFRYLAVYQ